MFKFIENFLSYIKLERYTREVKSRIKTLDMKSLEDTLNEYTDAANELYTKGYEVEIQVPGGRPRQLPIYTETDFDTQSKLFFTWLERSGFSDDAPTNSRQVQKATDRIAHVLTLIYEEISKRGLTVTRRASIRGTKSRAVQKKLSLKHN